MPCHDNTINIGTTTMIVRATTLRCCQS